MSNSIEVPSNISPRNTGDGSLCSPKRTVFSNTHRTVPCVLDIHKKQVIIQQTRDVAQAIGVDTVEPEGR